jgi:hypothetical protein
MLLGNLSMLVVSSMMLMGMMAVMFMVAMMLVSVLGSKSLEINVGCLGKIHKRRHRIKVH